MGRISCLALRSAGFLDRHSRARSEPGISRFQVWSFGPSRNDGVNFPLNQRQLAIDHQQHAIELVAAAQDQPACRDHAVNALLAGEPRIFFDTIDRYFQSAAEHREHRAVPQEINGVVAPLTIGDHAPVQIQDTIEFETIERHPAWQWTRSGVARRCATLAWIGFLRYRTHAGSPVISTT